MKKNYPKVLIDGFEIDCFMSLEEAVAEILKNRLANSEIAVAINPEKILSARESVLTKECINNASLRYIDGTGVLKVAESKLNKKLARVPGCELWEALMKEAGKLGKSVFLLGATSAVVIQTKHDLEQKYNTKVIGFHNGFFEDDESMINEILSHKPDILTVALGSPKQEQFMSKCKEYGVTSFMMGVGGTYNVFTGSVKRAPKFWCDLGGEWLYRLLIEPTRIKRQVKLLKFVALFLTRKL